MFKLASSFVGPKCCTDIDVRAPLRFHHNCTMRKIKFLQNPVEWSGIADNRRIYKGGETGIWMNGAKTGMNGATNGNGYVTISQESWQIHAITKPLRHVILSGAKNLW